MNGSLNSFYQSQPHTHWITPPIIAPMATPIIVHTARMPNPTPTAAPAHKAPVRPVASPTISPMMSPTPKPEPAPIARPPINHHQQPIFDAQGWPTLEYLSLPAA